MLKYKYLFAGLLISASSMGLADTIAKVTCYTAGDRPIESFRGTLGAAEITDLPQGGFNVKGRPIEIRKQNSAADVSRCRDWSLDYVKTRYEGYAYLQKKRLWNTLRVDVAQETKRMTCAAGSVVSEFDSVDAYKQPLYVTTLRKTLLVPAASSILRAMLVELTR